MVSLIAVNDVDGGEATCRILIGGRLVSEQTSTGPYASAGCSGNAGGESANALVQRLEAPGAQANEG